MKSAVLIAIFAGSLFGQSYTVSTFAGGGLPVNVPATSVGIGYVSSVAVDPAGNVFFVSGNAVIRLDAVTKLPTLVAGTGIAGFSGDNGPATSARLDRPIAVAVDSAGDVYIADSARIRRVSGGIITTIAGNGIAGASGDNGPAVNSQVAPLAMTVDGTGNVYVANTLSLNAVPGGIPNVINSGSIRKISNGTITTIAGNGTCCTPSSDNVSATSVPLYQPSGIAVDGTGTVYLASSTTGAAQNSPGGTVRKITGGIITTVAGQAGTSVQFSLLGGLALDSAGNLYIADIVGNRIREVSQGVITTVAGSGASGFSGDNGPAIDAELVYPGGVALDSAGNVYIADTNNLRVREVSHGVIGTIAGNGYVSYGGDNGPATSAQLFLPAGIALDTAGNLFFADSGNASVREVSNSTIATVAGNGTYGYSGDNGPATSAELKSPQGIALDSAGNLYIADAVVRKVSKGVITTVAGGGNPASGIGDGGPATSAALNARAVAVDSAGNLYISDDTNIRKVSNGIITTVAGNGTYGFSGDGGPATAAQLFAPAGIAVDSAGNLYIADAGNVRIRKVSNGIITTVAGNGTTGFAGDGGPATAAEMYGTGASVLGPQVIALDSAGNLYIVNVDRIRKVSNGIISTVAGPGAAFSAAIGASGLAVDPAGDIYFSYSLGTDNRIQVLKPCGSACPVPSTPVISAVVNAASFQPAIESGSWVAIEGNNLANSKRTWNALDFTSSELPTQLDGVGVTIDGRPAFVEYISPTQINVQAYYDPAVGPVSVVVTNNGAVSPAATAQLQSVAPALFMSGTSAVASILPGYTVVTANTPAMPGDLVVLWGTGFGETNPPIPFGTVVSGAPATTTLPTVTVGGVPAPVISAVLTAGTVGLYQITIRIPTGVPTGAAAVQASVGGASTQSGVTLFVGAQ